MSRLASSSPATRSFCQAGENSMANRSSSPGNVGRAPGPRLWRVSELPQFSSWLLALPMAACCRIMEGVGAAAKPPGAASLICKRFRRWVLAEMVPCWAVNAIKMVRDVQMHWEALLGSWACQGLQCRMQALQAPGARDLRSRFVELAELGDPPRGIVEAVNCYRILAGDLDPASKVSSDMRSWQSGCRPYLKKLAQRLYVDCRSVPREWLPRFVLEPLVHASGAARVSAASVLHKLAPASTSMGSVAASTAILVEACDVVIRHKIDHQRLPSAALLDTRRERLSRAQRFSEAAASSAPSAFARSLLSVVVTGEEEEEAIRADALCGRRPPLADMATNSGYASHSNNRRTPSPGAGHLQRSPTPPNRCRQSPHRERSLTPPIATRPGRLQVRTGELCAGPVHAEQGIHSKANGTLQQTLSATGFAKSGLTRQSQAVQIESSHQAAKRRTSPGAKLSSTDERPYATCGTTVSNGTRIPPTGGLHVPGTQLLDESWSLEPGAGAQTPGNFGILDQRSSVQGTRRLESRPGAKAPGTPGASSMGIHHPVLGPRLLVVSPSNGSKRSPTPPRRLTLVKVVQEKASLTPPCQPRLSSQTEDDVLAAGLENGLQRLPSGWLTQAVESCPERGCPNRPRTPPSYVQAKLAGKATRSLTPPKPGPQRWGVDVAAEQPDVLAAGYAYDNSSGSSSRLPHPTDQSTSTVKCQLTPPCRTAPPAAQAQSWLASSGASAACKSGRSSLCRRTASPSRAISPFRRSPSPCGTQELLRFQQEVIDLDHERSLKAAAEHKSSPSGTAGGTEWRHVDFAFVLAWLDPRSAAGAGAACCHFAWGARAVRRSLASKIGAQKDANERLLQEACARLSRISRSELMELKSLRTPAEVVRLTCECVLSVASDGAEGTGGWSEVRRAMQQSNFLMKLLRYDKVPVSAASRVRLAHYCTVDAPMARLRVQNRAVVALGAWLHALHASSTPVEEQRRSAERLASPRATAAALAGQEAADSLSVEPQKLQAASMCQQATAETAAFITLSASAQITCDP
eukprot:gnl/TRDRNA2_/TRDRNA2_197951_c0_seq1.p1 gnl/TRDRNA2_/TRDRNA2_197951_c0~~gnl/TRDRNA2_/TRDRNA2_197951_c0_seq1.p1  ORF type:complete len:1033 (+),score=107.64 gnl/TRDRNA2_/TRDRNA2_197951_c0_seq1:187-3285(+)